MKTLAWIILFGNGLGLIFTPLCFGLPRKPYSYADFIRNCIELGITIPVIGRILGWW